MFSLLITGALVSIILFECGRAIYNLFWHPLARFPGPKLWIAFPVFRYLSNMRGRLEWEVYNFHEKYGDVVRFSDIELSFTTAQAWKDIYGHGHKQLPKLNRSESGAPPDILFSNDADHARFRKAVSHGFSEKGLRAQEPLIREHVDCLVTSLKDEADAGRPTDLTMWYNLTTFDIISDLAFGKSFQCLKSRRYNEYITAIFDFVRAAPMVHFMNRYPLLWNSTLGLFYNGHVKSGRSTFRALSRKTALQRAHDPEMAGRGDLMDSMLRHRGEKDGLDDTEIASNANVLFLAGSETTATLLSGLTYWLLKTPEALRKASDEVRSAFDKEEDIDFTSASQKLPYMLACLNEGFRKYPPVPGILPRITVNPTNVSGHMVPPGAFLGVHQISSYWSARNFHRPDEFLPERWLSEASTNPSSPFYHDNRDVIQPFSVGPRNCIGRNLAYNEMRVILARVLWNFDLGLVGGLGEKNDAWEDQKIFLLWQKHPLMCTLKNRSGT